MTAQQLIEELKKMPPNAEVWYLWDWQLRSEADLVYLTKDGRVAISEFSEVCRNDADRPVNAPSEKENKYWELPYIPNPTPDDWGWYEQGTRL